MRNAGIRLKPRMCRVFGLGVKGVGVHAVVYLMQSVTSWEVCLTDTMFLLLTDILGYLGILDSRLQTF
jgi:DMSO reductase anchor subunit